jgi:hypothetical protein
MTAPRRKVSPSSTPPVRPSQGELQSTALPYLIHDLAERHATGILTVSGAVVTKTIHFQDGRVRFATSSDRDDRFNQTLLKAGVISLRNLLRALEVSLATRDRLGEVLVRSKIMAAADIEKWVKVQVREIIFSLFNGDSGSWSFEDRPIGVETIALDASGDVIVIEGVRRVTSWARISEEVGGLNTEYLATQRMPEIVRDLPLLPGERALLQQCRTPTSLGEMCDASDLGDFQVCRSIWALLVVGALMKS